MWLKYPENKPEMEGKDYVIRRHDSSHLISKWHRRNQWDFDVVESFDPIPIGELRDEKISLDIQNPSILDEINRIAAWCAPKSKEQEEREKEQIEEKLRLTIKEHNEKVKQEEKAKQKPELTLREALEILDRVKKTNHSNIAGWFIGAAKESKGSPALVLFPGNKSAEYIDIESKILSLKKELEEVERPKSGEGWVIDDEELNKRDGRHITDEPKHLPINGRYRKIRWEVVE